MCVCVCVDLREKRVARESVESRLLERCVWEREWARARARYVCGGSGVWSRSESGVVSSELEIEHITRGVCYWCEKAGLLIKKLPYLIKKLPYLRHLIDHSKPGQNSPHE